MQSTLSESVRAQSVELLNKHLTAANDLQARTKPCYWNVRGPGFVAIHELFDNVSMVVKNYSDLLAERAGGLGAAQVAAEQSALARHPLDFADEHRHVFAVCGTLAAFGQSVQEAAGQATNFGDADTAGLFAEISRGIDLQSWFVEFHIAPKMAEKTCSRPRRQTHGNDSLPARATTRVPARPSASAKARRAAAEIHERIEIRGN